MQVSSILTGHLSTASFANAVNNKSNKNSSNAAQNGSVTDYFKSSIKKDTGKDRISSLMERKQKILDMKEEKRQSDIAKGYDSKAIEADLAQYDSMTADIDQQITQAKQDKIKKAEKGNKDSAQSSKQIANTSSGSQDGFRSAAAEQSRENMQALSSMQATEQNIQAVNYAKRVLKVQALSYQPSHAFPGHPEASAKLSAKADGLQAKIAGMEQEMNSSAKAIAETSGKAVKNARETGKEKYKESEESLTGSSASGEIMDVYA